MRLAIVSLSALAIGLGAGSGPGMAQPIPADLFGEDACRDIKRLVEAATDGFAPFILQQHGSPVRMEALHYSAKPIAGFGVASIVQTLHRTDTGQAKAAVYMTSEHTVVIEKPNAGALVPATISGPLVDRVAQCVGASDRTRGLRAGETDVSVLMHRDRGSRVVRVALKIAYPVHCPRELLHALYC